jgi:hypothetical protein
MVNNPRPPRHLLSSRVALVVWAALLACIVSLALTAVRSAASEFGPLPPSNPYTAANGAATMHSDSESSGASPYPGPGTGTQVVVANELGAACPTVLQGSDGMPVALCTSILGRNPVVYLLDPGTGATLASLSLPAGNLFAGVYAYMDQENRVVLFNAEGDLLRIGHHYSAGHWTLSIDSSTPAAAAIDEQCASAAASAVCGGVVGIAPDWDGRVWFATADGVAGYVEPETGAVKAIALGSGEQVANSISTAPEGTAIATDHALYFLIAGKKDPKIVWRYAYERGPARKPGQLSHGTGSTPVFFGPEDGTRYLTILDNASPAEDLLVFDTWAHSADPVSGKIAKEPQLVCDLPVLTPGPSGSENAPVGSGRSVFVASTYGYPYPSLPEGAEASQPESAPFTGGVERVDLSQDGNGCASRWQDEVRSAAVPRLDVANGVLYTVQDTDPLQPDGTGYGDLYSEDAIDAATGQVLHQTLLGASYLFNTLQLSPSIVPGEVMYQGTVTGILRIAPVS